MQSWNSRFDALEISHLRSPAFAHPVAFEPTALVDFAGREGRHDCTDCLRLLLIVHGCS